MSPHRILTIRDEGVERVARSYIGGTPAFALSYDGANGNYKTQWTIDPSRERDNVLDAATMFMWCFNNRIIVASRGHAPETTPAERLYETIKARDAKRLELTAPIVGLDIASRLITCRAKDRLVHPLADLIMQTGRGRWDETHNDLQPGNLEPGMYRPVDLLMALREAYRLL